ncbi:MAG TPA: hypothetical protein VJ646_15810 [Candidatus Binatia bacterium]|nr:hypothetical protein [Candidatus Binatia bacterium]
MTRINRAALGLTLALALTVSAGCSDNNFALVGRDTLPASATQAVPDEFVAMVERVDLQRGSFEIRDQSRERVLVSLPYNARRSDVDHFRALRVGD